MRGNRKRDTGPELLARRGLWAAGLRFRVDYPIQVQGRRPVHVDIAFPRRRIAVFIDGCFWHRCPTHCTSPRTNAEYWDAKLESNLARDARASAQLEDAGWTVLRLWEHEGVGVVVATVQKHLDARQPSSTRASVEALRATTIDPK
jgi:DNA mismatch endonuclease (patch repair protein)